MALTPRLQLTVCCYRIIQAVEDAESLYQLPVDKFTDLFVKA